VLPLLSMVKLSVEMRNSVQPAQVDGLQPGGLAQGSCAAASVASEAAASSAINAGAIGAIVAPPVSVDCSALSDESGCSRDLHTAIDLVALS
jgi:hypothetical protein